MRSQSLCTALFAAGFSAPLCAETITLKSPDGKNEIQLIAEESLQYAVVRNGQVRVSPTAVSLTVDGKGVLGAKPKVTGKQTRAVTGVLKTPVYKKSEIKENGNETTVSFEGGYQVVLRADDDGVAYRFVTAFDGKIKVTDEMAAINFPTPELTAYVGYNWGNRDDPKQDKLQNSWESI